MTPQSPVHLELGPDEAEEIFTISEAILKDNGPEGAQFLRGDELVAKTLLFNDPENYITRNRQRLETVEEIFRLKGMSANCYLGTYREAEVEFEYLSRIANVYLKLYRAGVAA